MTALVHDLAGTGTVHDRIHGGLTAEVFADLASAEALWRALEATPSCVATPYQRFDWVAAFVEGTFPAEEAPRSDALRVMVLRDAGGRPRALIPLRVSREAGVRVARVVGGKHANFHMPLFASREAAAMPAEELRAALVHAGRRIGIDVYALDHQPRFWDGVPNPMSAGGQPCASNAYGVLLGPDPDASLRRLYSSEARKKLRAKERKLAEAHGPVEHRCATAPEDIASVLDTFYSQKSQRMASLGFADPYAAAAIRRFLALASRFPAEASSPASAMPAIELHALVRKADGHILATFAGAVDRDRFCGMWNSFDGDPELGRFSLGEILLHHLIGAQTAAGRRAFDLGVGEARYKANLCDETIELVETVIPASLRGHAFAAWANGRARLKRRIKASPRLMTMVRRTQRLRSA